MTETIDDVRALLIEEQELRAAYAARALQAEAECARMTSELCKVHEDLALARHWLVTQAEVADAELDKMQGRLDSARSDLDKLRRIVHDAIVKPDESNTTVMRAKRKGS